MSVCQIAADDGRIRSFARKRRAVETAGSDFDLGDPSVRKNYDRLGTRLTAVIGTVRLTMIEYIPSAIDALNAAMRRSRMIEPVVLCLPAYPTSPLDTMTPR